MIYVNKTFIMDVHLILTITDQQYSFENQNKEYYNTESYLNVLKNRSNLAFQSKVLENDF